MLNIITLFEKHINFIFCDFHVWIQYLHWSQLIFLIPIPPLSHNPFNNLWCLDWGEETINIKKMLKIIEVCVLVVAFTFPHSDLPSISEICGFLLSN